MKKGRKIALGVVGVLGVGMAIFAVVLSHDSACTPPPTVAAQVQTMKAIASRCYGGPDVLTLEEVPKPIPADDQLLVKVHAAGVNPLDWHYMRGKPYIMRLMVGIGTPKSHPYMGVDFAGTVEAVGAGVTRFKPGDEVFGGRTGSFAEYLVIGEAGDVVHKPASVSFEEAAAVPVAAITALQALRDQGNVQRGQEVLINGASGGTGTYAVQIAKAMGAVVTGVCSTRNLELVKSLGADHVIDYTRENFTRSGKTYDVIIDAVGSHSLSDYRRALTPDGIFVIIGAKSDGNWIGALSASLKAKLVAPFVSQPLKSFVADIRPEDLGYLADLMANGQLVSSIEKRYPLHEAPQAIAFVEEGHTRGKVVVSIE